MAPAPEPTIQAEQAVFEPDEVTFADDRVAVTGRWFGVRGRRFVRPTLILGPDGAGSRMLADLEHKPWTAEDGEPWTASFAVPGSSGGADELELAVAPDIAVVLRAPEALRSRPKRDAQPRRRASAGRFGESNAARNGHGGPNMAASQAKVEQQQAEIARLERLLRRNEIVRAEFKAAMSRRDAAVAKLDAVLEERDAAVAERDAAVAERNAAFAAQVAAVNERDAIRDDHRRVARERDALEQERDVLGRRQRELEQERDVLGRRQRELERAQAELAHERDQLRANLAEAIAARRDATRQERSEPVPVPPVVLAAPARPTPRLRAANLPSMGSIPAAPARAPRSPTVIWLTRGIALAVLLAAVVALLLILQSV